MKTRSAFACVVLVVVVGVLGSTVFAASMAELEKRFAERLPQLNKLKAAGKIGETSEGYVEAVDPAQLDAAGSKLVADENADRTTLYQAMAKQNNITPEAVGKGRGARNFEKAKPGESFKKDGTWIKK